MCRIKSTSVDVLFPGIFKVGQIFYGVGLSGMLVCRIKLTSVDVLFPGIFKVGQIFYGVGLSGMLVCCAVGTISMLRQFKSMTNSMCLAAGLIPTSQFSFDLNIKISSYKDEIYLCTM